MYWQKSCKGNTRKTLEKAVNRLEDSQFEDVVIASNVGETVRKFLEIADGFSVNTVCVTHHVGFREPGVDEMGQKTRDELKELGVEILTTTHALAGVARSVKKDYGGLYPAEIMAQALIMFGQGVKVSVEILIMALDAGPVPYGREIIAVGGTRKRGRYRLYCKARTFQLRI